MSNDSEDWAHTWSVCRFLHIWRCGRASSCLCFGLSSADSDLRLCVRWAHFNWKSVKIIDLVGLSCNIVGHCSILKASVNELPWKRSWNRVRNECSSDTNCINNLITEAITLLFRVSCLPCNEDFDGSITFRFICDFFLDLSEEVEINARFWRSWLPSDFGIEWTWTLRQVLNRDVPV